MPYVAPEITKLVLERIHLHPHGSASDISASLELDGIKISPLQVRLVMKRTQHERQQIQAACCDEPQAP